MIGISGIVKDYNGETLVGANIFISDKDGLVINPPKGTTTDVNGKFKLEISSGDYITCSFVGYKKEIKKISSNVAGVINFNLAQSLDSTLSTVEIVTNRIAKPKIPIGIIIFASFTALLIITGGIIQYNETK